MRWRAGVVVVALAACGGTVPNEGAAVAPEHLPLANDEAVAGTGPATDLAPSQIAASTVPRPATPPPCVVDDLTFWTAQVRVGEVTADAVIRVRNDADQRCEADIGGTQRIDPAIEPDVWLEPGDWADLVAGQQALGCVDPGVESHVGFEMNGAAVLVPTVLVTCGWWLAAFYPAERATDRCVAEDLDVAVTGTALAVRNSTARPCMLGVLVAAEGVEVVARDESQSADVAITALGAGDVVAFRLRMRTGAECSDQTATLRFEIAGDVQVEGLGRCWSIESGPARPWFGSSAAVLDPFSDDA